MVFFVYGEYVNGPSGDRFKREKSLSHDKTGTSKLSLIPSEGEERPDQTECSSLGLPWRWCDDPSPGGRRYHRSPEREGSPPHCDRCKLYLRSECEKGVSSHGYYREHGRKKG